MKRLACFAVLALSGCSAPTQPAGSSFDPAEFFTGESHGEATLRTLVGSSHVSVDSFGRATPGGGVILDQRIREGDKAPRNRRWVLRPAGPNRWTGTLTDAEGPVTVVRTPDKVLIDYETPSGQAFEQSLVRLPSGKVDNLLTVHKWGIRLATLHEIISKAT
jgi:hypothetical protein